ncbi:MAG: M16 family metallopeptidase [Planctomycetota bacterium]
MAKRFYILALTMAALYGVAAAKEPPALEMDLGVHEATLDNGLRVLLVPRQGAPRVACRLAYRVGSVDERPGITGISHLLEHMMFKGTERIGTSDWERDRKLLAEIDRAWAEWKRAETAGDAAGAKTARALFDEKVRAEKEVIKKDELWAAYQAAGASALNAFTSQDVTCYITTLPKNRIELFFWLEADRMQHAVTREFYSEREVVKEERRLGENSPTGPFGEALNALAFSAHPYRWPVVGWMSDLDAITREDVDEYRRTYYTPRNAVLCLVGDLDVERCMTLARRYFGSIPAGPQPPKVGTVEPEQKGRKTLEWKARAAPQVRVLYHTPEGDHPDTAPLAVLEGILSGEAGRLEERLVRQLGIARSARAYASAQLYPDVFSIHATAAGETDPERLLAALEMEVTRIREEKVGEEELTRVKTGIVADRLRILRNISRLGVRLAMAEARGDWRQVLEFPRNVQKVTAKDVQRVARAYLRGEAATVGILRREKEVAR